MASLLDDELVQPPRHPGMLPDWWNEKVRRGAGSLVDMFTVPGRAYRQGITTEEAVPWAAETAMNLAGTGAPFASKNAIGIFGGRGAVTADQQMLKTAEDMAAKGASRDDIWKQTGWFQGADKKWRFEIPDKAAAVRAGEDAPWRDLVSHPDFFKAYPQTEKYTATIDRGSGGQFFPHLDHMRVRGYTPENMTSTALHEMQHAIQQREGFARGGAPSNFVYSNDPLFQYRKSYETPEDAYRRLAGEVEARNVQKRMKMTPEKRRATPPWQTQDIPDEQQIVRIGNRTYGK